MKNTKLESLNGFIFDLDGTIYLGEALLPGARELIRVLRHDGKKLLFLSNKPLETRQDYAEKLTRLGIPTSYEEVLTSAHVLGAHLARHEPDLRLYVIGEKSLKAELQAFGLTMVDEFLDQDASGVIDPAGIEAVVLAFDRTLDYRKLNTAYQALKSGARFFATNTDKVCPMPGGAIPDAGATAAALEHITGRKSDLVAGKPSPLMLKAALDILALPADQCMLVGDRLETDILMGRQAGMLTTLVLTGVTSRNQVTEQSVTPDIILDTLFDLLDLLS